MISKVSEKEILGLVFIQKKPDEAISASTTAQHDNPNLQNWEGRGAQ
jgi:hypothetical protein